MKQANGSSWDNLAPSAARDFLPQSKPKKIPKTSEEEKFYSLPLFFEENSSYPKTASLIFGKLPIKIPLSHFIPLKQVNKETGILIGRKSADSTSDSSEANSSSSSSSVDSQVEYTICSRDRYPINLIIDLTELDSSDDENDGTVNKPPGFMEKLTLTSIINITLSPETLQFEMDNGDNKEKKEISTVDTYEDKPTIINAEHQVGDKIENEIKEKNTYETPEKMTFQQFPIEDGGIPKDMNVFVDFLDYIDTCLSEGASIYVHCRNGRGRSGTVVACLLKYCFRLNTETALDIINACHRGGHGDTKKWKKKIIPSHKIQRKFINSF